MKNLFQESKRLLTAGLAVLMALPCCISGTAVIGAGIFGAAMSAPNEANAGRGRSRTVVRGAGPGPRPTTVRHTSVHRTGPVVAPRGPASPAGAARRTTRRTARRVTRRRLYALPAGHRVINYGGYRYYYYSGLYYYPYYQSGQTVYIQIELNEEDQPLPPPPATQINTQINVYD